MIVHVLVFVYLTRAITSRKVPFTLEEVYHDRIGHFNSKWFTSRSGTSVLEHFDAVTGDVVAYDTSANETFILLPSDALRGYDTDWYRLSPDRTHVLLRRDSYKDSVQPWLTTHKYTVYSRDNRRHLPMGNYYLQHAEWIPGKLEIVFVKSNNIYIAEVLPKMAYYPITKDGVPGVIYNGIPDSGNEEDKFNRRNPIAMSPDGNHIAYLSQNHSEIPVTSFPVYGKPGIVEEQYPKVEYFRYSKPGQNIATYTVWHLNRATNERRILAATAVGREIPGSMSWVSDKVLQIVFLNRQQNVSVTSLCSVTADYPCRKVYEDRNGKGWASDRLLTFSKEGGKYIARTRQQFGQKEFYHLEIVYRNGTKFSLTAGNFSVGHVVDWDESKRLVYYQSHKANQPSTSHTFAVHENRRGKPYCLTCRMKSPEGVPCKFGSVAFSGDFRFFTGTCRGPVPWMLYLYKNVIPVADPVQVIYDSAETRKWLEGKLEPKVVNLRVPVTDTMKAEVRLKLPPVMDYSGRTKYPMIIHVYGGPDSGEIQDRFQIDWSLYLNTNRSIIYGIIDGRGTGRKSSEMLYSVYKALGTVEVEDQITVTKYIHGKLRFVDKNRTGIWGWGYGGYVTTKVLENDDQTFKCGAAVAPITDWLYYDAVYTERYMDQPRSNPTGYTQASTLHDVDNLRHKPYLLIHGTGDRSVHYQHAMALSKALQSRNIIFEQASYPDEDHSISSSRLHVFQTMDRFFEKCFNLPGAS